MLTYKNVKVKQMFKRLLTDTNVRDMMDLEMGDGYMLTKINTYKEIIIFYLLLIFILFVVSLHNQEIEVNSGGENKEFAQVYTF